MTNHRKGEADPVPFRSGRFFNVESNWYFATREHIDQGPYSSREQAEKALQEYLATCQRVEAVWH
jgi:hypothetical protein